MSECVVIADDLTGGNATGVLLKKMKYVAHTVLNMDAIDQNTLQQADVPGRAPLFPQDRQYPEG